LNLKWQKVQALSHRQGVKLGVVYVGPGCEDQNAILSTSFDRTSPHFREFLTGLGWAIDLPTHVGYCGGLDVRQFSNGQSSIYYADFMNEVMYHVAPLMPTDIEDETQLKKKRHIGNDPIHIVWCELGKEYDPTTITSQFNQAHIIVYPLLTGLFRVDVICRKDMPWFGPLRHSVVVCKKALPSLVRATAVQAMHAFYRSQSPWAYPQMEIVNTCKEMIANHARNELHFEAIDALMRIS
jgi:hypothetical protein